jgi:hypothetical protein
MSRLSRPYQIALGAIALLAVVWLLALRPHKSSSGEESATSSTPTSTTSKAKPSLPTAPGVAGLTRAIEKAHGAVAQSEQNAKQLQQKSAEASSPTASTPGDTATAGARARTPRTHAAPGSTKSSTPSRSHASAGTAAKPHPSPSARGALSGELLVNKMLTRGYTVALLFWNPESSEDGFVHAQLQLLLAAERGFHRVSVGGRELGDASVVEEPRGQREEKLFLIQAPASRVASFGSVTRVVQVFETPTLLIVGPKQRLVKPLTGFRSAFAIEQALDEAPSA